MSTAGLYPTVELFHGPHLVPAVVVAPSPVAVAVELASPPPDAAAVVAAPAPPPPEAAPVVVVAFVVVVVVWHKEAAQPGPLSSRNTTVLTNFLLTAEAEDRRARSNLD